MGDIWPLVNGLVGAIIGALGLSLSSYFRKKGENLATKEDIGAITREIEQIRSEFGVHMENVAQRNRLQLAAIDKRLEVHQKAYALCAELCEVVEESQNELKVSDAVYKCHCWWEENCLYLNEETRQEFASVCCNPDPKSEQIVSVMDALERDRLEIIQPSRL